MSKYPEAMKALEKAKIQLMMNRQSSVIFYTTILFSLKQLWATISTAGVDGKNLFINPEWFLSLTEKQRIGLILHEVLHVALNHMTRLGERDKDVFNQAGDHVINLLLIASGYELPPCGLWDKRFTGMSTEQVYNILIKEQPPPMDFPDIIFTPAGTDSSGNDQIKEMEIHIANSIIRAKIQAENGHGADDLPGEILIQLEKSINPKLPWNIILFNFMSDHSKNNYSMQRPNRRYMPDFYLPTLYSESICNLAIGVDISGSVTDQEFSYFIHEIDTIHKKLQPEKIDIISFDTEIKKVQRVNQTSNILKDLKFHGRGGTRIQPLMDWAKINNPEVLLIFSDGDFHKPQSYPTVPIIWLIHNRPSFTVEKGRVIHYEIKNN